MIGNDWESSVGPEHSRKNIMATKGEKFAGLTVAMVTPFKNGKLDEAALRKLVDWHVEQGTDTVCPVGTTGETSTLSHEEHRRVVELCVKTTAGRVPVIATNVVNNTTNPLKVGIVLDGVKLQPVQ